MPKLADRRNPGTCGNCILAAALQGAIAPETKSDLQKSSPGFWDLPPHPFPDRQNPFIQR